MKIVAIGGGNNSNIRKNGEEDFYEHENIDKEIIKLTNKRNPNFLFISHASSSEFEFANFRKLESTYGKMYNCKVKILSIDMLNNFELYNKLIDWANIIYVGSGNIKKMMDIWQESGLDHRLILASKEDKVLCGTSAGGGCWFKYTCTDSLHMEEEDMKAQFMKVPGLGIVNLVFNPHASYHGRMKAIEDITKEVNLSGVSLTNNMAIEIVDDKYKLIKGISSSRLATEAILSYWQNGEYYIEPIEEDGLISELEKNKTNGFQKKKKMH